MTGKRERIGIFGGTFDPIHCGHLRVAVEVREEIGLDRMILVPAGIPAHKTRPDMAEASDRLEMVRLACQGLKDFEVSSIELERTGPSYTVDTLSYFSSLLSGRADIFFIMGIDAFMQFHTWKEPEKILRLASLVVMTRPGLEAETESQIQALDKYLGKLFSDSYKKAAKESVFRHPELSDVHYQSVTGLDISGTSIRSHVLKGKSLSFLVPEKVEEYIVFKGLYKK